MDTVQALLQDANADQSLPTQAQAISRYTNAALSDLIAQTHAMLQAGYQLDRQLLAPQRGEQAVWLNTAIQQTKNHSTYYRPFKHDTL